MQSGRFRTSLLLAVGDRPPAGVPTVNQIGWWYCCYCCSQIRLRAPWILRMEAEACMTGSLFGLSLLPWTLAREKRMSPRMLLSVSLSDCHCRPLLSQARLNGREEGMPGNTSITALFLNSWRFLPAHLFLPAFKLLSLSVDWFPEQLFVVCKEKVSTLSWSRSGSQHCLFLMLLLRCVIFGAERIWSPGPPVIQTPPSAFSEGTSLMHFCAPALHWVHGMLNSFWRAKQITTPLLDGKLIVSVAAGQHFLGGSLPSPWCSITFSFFYLERGNLGVTGAFLITSV